MTTAPKASARKAPASAYAAPSTRGASDIPSGTHSSILEMQRAVGNHAVSQSMESYGAGVAYREIPYDLQRVLGSDHGRPLDIPIRTIMESRFGRDFTNV